MKVSVIALTAAMLLGSSAATAQKSNTKGFMLGLYLNGSSINGPEQEGEKTETESGGGLGARLGWGFNENFTGFLGMTAAAVKFGGENPDDETYGLAHLDLGVTYNFFKSDKAFRPYVELALSTRAMAYEGDLGSGSEQEFAQAGGAFTLGGGFNYFFSRSAALNLGLMFSGGDFDNVEIDGNEVPGTSGSASTTRFNVGLTWYPMKK